MIEYEIEAPNFSLPVTLSSGQAFRWKTDGNSWYYGILGKSVVKIRQEDNRLICVASDKSLEKSRIQHYFALDLNLPEILSSINVDMQIHHAISQYPGLRILRQDSWEVLATFICSSFNNIRRIERIIEQLCQEYGEPITLQSYRSFSFPDARTIAGVSERKLRSLGLGYRAPYLKATAKLVADKHFVIKQMERIDYPATKRALLACEGVGDKVADCVALFGFQKYEAFPIDVWMERAMRYYFRHKRMTRKALHEYAHQHFGLYAGYAQQYLYHYIRNMQKVSDKNQPVKNSLSSLN